MADGISLLPEEYKKKEEEERKKRAKEKPAVAFYVPGQGKTPSAPAPKALARPGLFGRFFARKPKPLIAKPGAKPALAVPAPTAPLKAPPLSAPPALSQPPKPAPLPSMPPAGRAQGPAPTPVPAPPPSPAAAPMPPKKRPSEFSATPSAGGGNVLRVSLIPEEGGAKQTKPKVGLTAVMATIVVSLLVVLGGWGATNAAGAAREQEIAGVDALIRQADVRIRETDISLSEARDAGRRLTALKTLLDRHVRWTGFFEWLERNTIPTVTFTQLRSESVGTVTLDATAQSFPAAAEQLVVFRTASQQITSVDVGALTADVAANGVVRGVRFTTNLTLASTLLTPDAPVKNAATTTAR